MDDRALDRIEGVTEDTLRLSRESEIVDDFEQVDLADGFYIGDDGPGIPEGERKKVFQAGYSEAESGTGLGLNIVEQIVVVHDWDICVTDGTEGGARFEVTGVELAAE